MTHHAFTTPEGSIPKLRKIVDHSIQHFPSNPMCSKLDRNEFSMRDYHSILRMLFHQVYYSSSSFSLAAAHCPQSHTLIRDYLIHHSEEEKTHWTWILNDLEKTDYGGDPRSEFPLCAAQSYIALNYYVATKHPISRLAIALILESVGANFGKRYGEKLVQTLKLNNAQILFFSGHGETDVGHTEDIWRVLEKSHLTPNDLGWMCHTAEVAGKLYFQMYEDAAK